MNFQAYQALIKEIKIGKHLPDAIYLHESSLGEISNSLIEFLDKTVAMLELDDIAWNIVKFAKKEFKISLLYYPDFFNQSYPVLKRSYSINLTTLSYRKTDYTKSENPPILHRKETFLAPSHPAIPYFKKITREGERAGLYENSRTIGFKKTWEKLIQQKGYALVDGHLKPMDNATSQMLSAPNLAICKKIERHKTAIDRNSLSAPMQSLFRHNYLNGKYSLFDYGCGKGDDLNILANHNISANGWDPVYCPDNKIKKADIINLGFVINVIENPQERKKTLKKAYRFAQKILVVAVMLGGEAITSKFEKYGDGIITSRKTFQKYYTQNELREYIEDTLQETAIAVGPGIFYIFRDKLEEQQFLIERQRIKRNWYKLSYTDHPDRLKVKQRALYERHKELLEQFWQQCLDLGRLPANDEFSKSEELRAFCFSHKKAFDLLTTIHGQESFKQVAEARRDDLLVHYALSLFSRRKPYKYMPSRLKKDIKYFFGNYTSCIKEATALLFSVGKPELINHYCEQAYKELGRGKLEKGHSFTIHRNDVELLPAQLRVYLGCATQLYGDIDTVDLVKIHIRSGKVSLMRYDDFEGKPLPLLMERIKIKLREQDIDFFEYGDEYQPQPLYLKGVLLHDQMPIFSKQQTFDKRLKCFEWLDISRFGPTKEEFEKLLTKNKLQIRGYRFYKITKDTEN